LLKLDRLSPLNQALRNQVLALSLAQVRDAVRETAEEHAIASTVADRVIEPYEARIQTAAAAGDETEAITERDRLTIGLIALASQERTMILDHREQQTASTRIVELLLRNIGRISDAARSDGRLGYKRSAAAILKFSPRFRLGQMVHRWLRSERLLARALADRFETLLVTRMLLEELMRFIGRRLASLLGPRIGEILGEVLTSRLEGTTKALDALRLQYPDYAEAMERRFLSQTALRQELLQYRSLFDDGLIGQELFDDLRREVAARRSRERQPTLDLGLNTKDLAQKVELFSRLAPAHLERVSALFKPRFVVPGQFIIRKGDRGDAVYFVSSGAVEVVLPSGNVRLGSGELFGEIALLNRQRRQADVKALTYCRLLVLASSDFDAFIAENPDARARINEVAEARTRMNLAAGSAA
jgi:CPA1 family monovalent cation:H+ antiporter